MMDNQPTPLGASLTDVVTNLLSIAKNIGALITSLNANTSAINQQTSAIEDTFPRVSGTFTMAAAASTVVSQSAITANSKVFLQAINAAAATLAGGVKAPYAAPADYVVGTSFTVKTANAAAAAGTEQFSYFVVEPA